MAVDVVLWFILAAMIALVWCGCKFTAPGRKSTKAADGALEQRFDRAA